MMRHPVTLFVVLLIAGTCAGECRSPATRTFWALGDSKSGSDLAVTGPYTNYVDALGAAIGPRVIAPYKDGVNGATAATRAASMAARIAELANDNFYQNVDFLLVTLGSNDVIALPAEAIWKTNFAAILDAYHTQWPNGKVGIALPWKRTEDADCATLATWIADVISTRSWATVALDEATLIKAGDDGATYTYDGIHYNDAGIAVVAAAWKTWMGY